MFNIGFAELLVILIIAYLIVGPKDLPKVARWLGRLVKRARQMIREIKDEVGWDEMMADTENVHRDVDETLRSADITADLKEARQTLRQNFREAEKETMKKDKPKGSGTGA